MGHGDQTIDRPKKEEKVEWFFSANIDESEKYQFLKDSKISYIFYSDEERKIGAVNIAQYPFLTPVYQNNNVTIYKVN